MRRYYALLLKVNNKAGNDYENFFLKSDFFSLILILSSIQYSESVVGKNEHAEINKNKIKKNFIIMLSLLES